MTEQPAPPLKPLVPKPGATSDDWKLPSLIPLQTATLQFGTQFGNDGGDAGVVDPTDDAKPVPVAVEFAYVPVWVLEPGVNGFEPV